MKWSLLQRKWLENIIGQQRLKTTDDVVEACEGKTVYSCNNISDNLLTKHNNKWIKNIILNI